MSTRIFMVVVAAVVALLALPLISQISKSVPGYRTEDASPNAPVETNTVEPAPAAAEPVQAVSHEPAPLTHTYDAPRNAFAAGTAAEAAPATVAPAQAAPQQTSFMTRTQFSQIGSGMTYEQCVQFIGCEGEFVRPAGMSGEEYAWQLVDDPSNPVSTGEATLTFQNGLLSGKGFNSNKGRRGSYDSILAAAVPAQRPPAPPYICRSVYDSLKDGCAYEQCARLLGMDGSYLGSRTMSAGTVSPDGTFVPAIVDVYVWQNLANRTTLTLSFRDGRLAGREISRSN